ncbi:hypothetical protein ANN_21907 [Periplaneta americana]|uniref:Uncharacterized protein n=1 Tax=Periplaneta americana TaxID=6978 RepID=A0ABQ8S6N6_PERAM|nr:hypothetical protein ANN_21907 [Periplaneta americana]
MAGLCEGGNEPPGSLKAIWDKEKLNVNKTKSTVNGRKINKVNVQIQNEAVEKVDTLSKKAVEKIDSFERKILKRIYGPVCVQGEWRIRYNNELYSMYGEPPLSHIIRIKRLKWAGHLIRMEEHRVPKKIFLGDFGGGIPHNRWEYGVCQDALQTLKIQNWRVAAQDRLGWRRATGRRAIEEEEKVDSFKYLGRTISSNMICCQEVKRRVAMANWTSGKITKKD